MDIIEIYSIKSEGKNYGIYESWDDAYNKIKRLLKKHPEKKFEIIKRKAKNLLREEKHFYNLPWESELPF